MNPGHVFLVERGGVRAGDGFDEARDTLRRFARDQLAHDHPRAGPVLTGIDIDRRLDIGGGDPVSAVVAATRFVMHDAESLTIQDRVT